MTPRFPDGFTVLTAQGQWRDADGAIQRENTRVLEIVHKGTPTIRRLVRAVARDYRHRFAQQSVLVMQSPSLQCS